jgi:hypothetical protein
MKINGIIKRIENILGIEGILEKLDRLSPTDLQSLLLGLYEKRSEKISAQSIFNQYGTNRFVLPSAVSQRSFTELEAIAFDLLPPDFNVVELSTVAPFGINSALTKNNQKKIMSTVRNLEVCADSTTALILECARRRKNNLREDSGDIQQVKCATNMRNIRLQNFEDIPGFVSHFKALTLGTVGRDCGYEEFEAQACLEHVGFYLDYLEKLSRGNFDVGEVFVSFSDIRIMEELSVQVGMDREKIGQLTQVPGFDPFHDFNIQLPAKVRSLSEISPEFAKFYGLEKFVSFLSIVEEKIVKVLIHKYPKVIFLVDLGRVAGIGYYSNLCFKIMARNKNGQIFPITDGGIVDWTQKLLQSRKERALASGFGTELFCLNFKK